MTISKPVVFGAIAAITVIVFIGLGYMIYASGHNRAAEIEERLKSAQKDLAAYTQYAKHLDAVKQALTEQQAGLAVTIMRDQAIYVHVKKSAAVFRADADIVLHLAIQYSFAFDLAADKFSLEATPGGLTVKVGPPILTAAPVVKIALVEVSDKSIVLDEDKAAAELMKQVTEDFSAKAAEVAKGDDVQTLCEKKLVDFLRDTLGKQPGVTFVPPIFVKPAS
jgi:hypothetical protein